MLPSQVGFYSSTASPIAIGTPVYLDTGTSTFPWDVAYTFDSANNLVIVILSFESNKGTPTVALDPAGANVALSQIGTRATGSGGLSNVEIWGVYNFTPLSGSKTVEADFGSNAAGSMAVFPFSGATRLPIAGDFDKSNSASAASLATALTIAAGSDRNGYVLSGLNVNGAPTTTEGGDQVQTHTYSGSSQGERNSFGVLSPTLAASVAPSWTYSATRCSMASVLAA